MKMLVIFSKSCLFFRWIHTVILACGLMYCTKSHVHVQSYVQGYYKWGW